MQSGTRICSGIVRFTTARICILSLCLLSASLLTACKKGPDASTPKKAGTIFVTAAQAGDSDTLHQVAKGTDAEFDMAKKIGQMLLAFNRFSTAASTKFGTDGDTRGMTLDIASDFDNAEEKIEGDSAHLIPKAGTSDESEPYHFIKDGSNWKLDLSFLDRDDTAKDKSRKLAETVPIWDQATKDVESGKFETFAAAKKAIKRRILRASLNESDAKIMSAQDDILSLEDALERYKTDAAEYPNTQDGLGALMQKPANATNWHGPYLKNSITKDPWGNPFIYFNPGAHNTNTYDLHSMGPDGKEGTPDDLDNWTSIPDAK
jgi:general secretion pathway protein G